MPRALSDPEIHDLLSQDVVLCLATLDEQGYPHVTPLWFVWDGTAVWATSKVGPGRERVAEIRAGHRRTAVKLVPRSVLAVANV